MYVKCIGSLSCASAHSIPRTFEVHFLKGISRCVISKEANFDDCVILPGKTFDPDAVFMDDIVDDDVLGYPDLAVDGLTGGGSRNRRNLELRPEDVAANEEIRPDTDIPDASLGAGHLDVYGWEPSLWKKLRGYLGF